MRRILLMVVALAMFMGLATTGAMASAKKSDDKGKQCKYGMTQSGKCKAKPKECKYGTTQSGKCKPKPKDPDECEHGVTADHQCMPDPDECEHGMTMDGHCKPECPFGEEEHGMCKPPPVVEPPPAAGPCAKSDLVLLEALLKGTGGLVCLYLGDNSPNATAADGGDCPGALLALPLDHLVGVCLYLPPADVGGAPTPAVGGLSAGTPLSAGGPLGGLINQLTGLLKLV